MDFDCGSDVSISAWMKKSSNIDRNSDYYCWTEPMWNMTEIQRKSYVETGGSIYEIYMIIFGRNTDPDLFCLYEVVKHHRRNT